METEMFFKNEEEFNTFLGKADHYKSLQNKIVRLANPQPGDIIFELGSGIGATAIQLAKKCKKSKIFAVDNREEVINTGKEIAERHGITNIEFFHYDMEKIGKVIGDLEIYPNTVIFLYSFHHIPDPINRKKRLAKDLFELCPSGTKIIIGDGISPVPAEDNDYKKMLLGQEEQRPKMMYLTVFWEEYLKAREGGESHNEAFSLAKKAANNSKTLEELVGKKLARREGEYPITLDELQNVWKEAGFRILLCEEVNVVGEAILFCVKE